VGIHYWVIFHSIGFWWERVVVSKRQYSDNDKASALAALDANKGNVNRTAQQLDIPRKTLEMWAANRHLSADVANIRQEKKASLAEKFEELAEKLVDDLIARVGQGKFVEEATAAAIAIDKMQLLKGNPTAISKDVSERTNEERAARILELVKPAKAA
jgi:transposase-like protein